jgi:hypothetical protein
MEPLTVEEPAPSEPEAERAEPAPSVEPAPTGERGQPAEEPQQQQPARPEPVFTGWTPPVALTAEQSQSSMQAEQPAVRESSADQPAAEPAPTEQPDAEATMVMPAYRPPAAPVPPETPAEQPKPGQTSEPSLSETMLLTPSGSAAAPSAPALPEAELTIENGPDSGHIYRLTGPALRVGRSPDNELILRDPATSGHHARVERRGNQFYVVDLGSTNGTMVNGETIQERELRHGDRIMIGQNAVKFSLI